MWKSCNEDLFKALADPTRRAIFEELCRNGEKTVVALTAAASIAQPGVSVHLRKLKQAGLVRDRPSGRVTYFSADHTALVPLVDWTKTLVSQGRKKC
ncbi:ArsR/SmtB family transcription factor [Rhizobium halophilum]|uniref:ArsR/SmtB family transcription factor n=1 Tax=Rhizobium halophilum TaxID=2846852 RepID=UPI001EFEEC45|nr:metalloregulator ArsR/SmtB family transcription factor [Rhizobium halophilum]MCF6370830.1 metalloregulator ArsR/SmtB family transcription factor [Rhizobium halophilum]